PIQAPHTSPTRRSSDLDYNLIGGFALKLRQLFVETLGRPRQNDAGVIVEITIRFRRNCFGGVRDDSAGEKREDSEAESSSHCRQDRKSTRLNSSHVSIS